MQGAGVFKINRQMETGFLSKCQGFHAMERCCMAMNMGGLGDNDFNKQPPLYMKYRKRILSSLELKLFSIV